MTSPPDRRIALIQTACKAAPKVDFCAYPRCQCKTEPRIIDTLIATGAIDKEWSNDGHQR